MKRAAENLESTASLPRAMIYVSKAAVIPEGKEIPRDSVLIGVPAKVVRRTQDFHRIRIEASWRVYAELARKTLPSMDELKGDAKKRVKIEGVAGLDGMF